MSFGYSVLGFGADATHVSGVSAPSSMIIGDYPSEYANTITYQINSATPVTRHATSTQVTVRANDVFHIFATSTYTGTAPTSWSWALTEVADDDNIATPTNGTQNLEDYVDSGSGPYITISSGASSGELTLYSLIVTGTNSGGSTASSTYIISLRV